MLDISEENQRYALELASCAGVTIQYEVGDWYDLDRSRFGECFDIAYSEGGVLHYFDDINRLLQIYAAILKSNGELILNDFHSFCKILPDQYKKYRLQGNGSGYFEKGFYSKNVAYRLFFQKNGKPFQIVLFAIMTSAKS